MPNTLANPFAPPIPPDPNIPSFPGLPAVCAWNVGCNKSTLGSNEVLLCIRGDERALFRAQTALETTLGKWLAQAT